MRAFLAIPVQAPALDAFLALRARLVDDLAAVRWAPPGSAHITLHFFGAVSPDDAARAVAALRPAMAAVAPMTLCLRGLGGFPATARPRVLWCGVGGEVPALASCAAGCAATLRDAGFPVDERPYRPHCTLGRPQPHWPETARRRWRFHVGERPATPSFTADRAVLYESTTAADGVVHIPRAEIALAGR